MKLRIVWIGRTREPNLAALAKDLIARIGRFLPIDVVELKDPRTADPQRQRDAESQRILAALSEADRVVLLDAGGKTFTSAQFADFLNSHTRNDPRNLTFVVGGYGGIAEALKERADVVWSLSPLTFTHEMARFIVLEQIYRALATLRNHPYAR